MKRIENISLKLLILVLVTGVVGIVGIIMMKYNISVMSKNYTLMVEDCVENSLHMTKISSMIYRHQALVSSHVLSQDTDEQEQIEQKEKELNKSIRAELAEMKGNMSGSQREKLYHEVYSDTIGYFKNVDNVFSMSRQGSTATAEYYINTVMAAYLDNINQSLADMESLTDAEMAESKARMDRNIFYSNLSETVCIFCIVITAAICLALCINITSRLERYRTHLEREVESKTGELLERSQRMLEIQDNTIIGMANLIENRDGDTGEHIKRTSKYVELLARAAQKAGYCRDVLTDEYIELMVKAAPMHDIGKITIPDSILKKPGRLTDEEFEKIKDHAAQGGRILCEVLGNIEQQKYIDIAAQMAKGHHEKWNGEGYPMGLRGDDIPLCARIMAIADVFDALVSKRCYKAAMTADQAFDIIEESSGTHFDPTLAKLFIGLRPEVEKILDEKE